MSTYVYVMNGLSKAYDNKKIPEHVTLTFLPGAKKGLPGPNGAGKSTSMKMITGFLAPTDGSISVCGHDVLTDPIAAKSRIGYLPEGAPAYGEMTPATFLSFIADIERRTPLLPMEQYHPTRFAAQRA